MRERTFSVATYNVHGWIGTDGRWDPTRAMRMIREMQVDVIALQEVSFPSITGRGRWENDLARETGFKVVLGPTFSKENHAFGNVLLAIPRILNVRRLDLSVRGREPRGALDVTLGLKDTSVRVIATHLGLRSSERRHQVKRLLDALSRKASGLVVLVGDFNEWSPASLSIRMLRKWFGCYPPTPRTFPSRLPLLSLNRIWVQPREALLNVRVYNTPLARRTSDHLPLKATLLVER